MTLVERMSDKPQKKKLQATQPNISQFENHDNCRSKSSNYFRIADPRFSLNCETLGHFARTHTVLTNHFTIPVPHNPSTYSSKIHNVSDRPTLRL